MAAPILLPSQLLRRLRGAVPEAEINAFVAEAIEHALNRRRTVKLDRLVSLSAAARITGMSKGYLWMLIKTGRVNGVKTGAHRIGVDLDDLRHFHTKKDPKLTPREALKAIQCVLNVDASHPALQVFEGEGFSVKETPTSLIRAITRSALDGGRK